MTSFTKLFSLSNNPKTISSNENKKALSLFYHKNIFDRE